MNYPEKIQAEELEKFYLLETSLHKKEVRNSLEKLSGLLSDDFVEFGSSGVKYDKAYTLESLKKEKVDLEITVEDFEAQRLSFDIVFITYTTSKLDQETGTKFRSLRSSIWISSDGKDQMYFHQGTKIPLK